MAGLTFKKLDLHIHTPASKCYRNRKHTANEIVKAAIEKGLNAIAITDHNTAEWIDLIKEAARGTSLIVFPGVEISMPSYHVVALFDPEKDQKHVEGFLNAIDITPEMAGKQDTICTSHTVYTVIDKIHERGGLAILAHIDTHKGAFFEAVSKDRSGKSHVSADTIALFNSASYDAVECSEGRMPDSYDEERFKRFPAFYQSSDNPDPENPIKHSLAGIGTKFSWFKLDEITLEGLRQCFTDPEVRIRLMDVSSISGYPSIRSLKVDSECFLGHLDLEFHPGLNSIIGGKGVGKSAVIELIRFALDQPTEIADLCPDYCGKIETLLGIGGTVHIVYELASGTRFQISRTLDSTSKKSRALQSSSVCIALESGSPHLGDVETTFPILAYSQTEVIRIAEHTGAQLELIDKFIDSRKFEQQVTGIRGQLTKNDRESEQALGAKAKLDDLNTELATLKTQIEDINKRLANPLFMQMEQAERKKQLLCGKREIVASIITIITKTQADIEKAIHELPTDFQEDEESKLLQNLAEQAQVEAITELEQLKKKIEKIAVDQEHVISSWLPRLQQVQADYQTLIETGDDSRQDLEVSRQDLRDRAGEIERQISIEADQAERLEHIRAERKQLLAELEQAYLTYYSARKAKFEEITELSDGKLQLEIRHAENHNAFAEILVDLLKGGANAIPIDQRRQIAEKLKPAHFVELVINRKAADIAEKAEITEYRANQVIEKLWSAEDFADILSIQHNCFPADTPIIRFRKAKGQYVALNELSVGQKCTALLIIALSQGEMPVIIDQPEDALDIVSVWEDVAQSLRRGKSQRQFIITTHNSTVAVGGDSDQFVVLDSTAKFIKVRAIGAIDRMSVKKEVVDHLEGGQFPYQLKRRKYDIN